MFGVTEKDLRNIIEKRMVFLKEELLYLIDSVVGEYI